MANGEITGLGARALSRAIHERQVSAREVMEATLARIAEVNPKINAIVSLREADALLAEADAADAELAAGRSRGAFHGIPQAIKDLAMTAGLPTTMGSPVFARQVPEEDSIHVARVRAAGAIIIGKTNVPEFGLGSHTYNPLFGPTLNPYDPAKSAGGSSGGAAAALATRMLCVADGSDMMGSLRNPGAFNNVLGLRPSLGRVPDGIGDQVDENLDDKSLVDMQHQALERRIRLEVDAAACRTLREQQAATGQQCTEPDIAFANVL